MKLYVNRVRRVHSVQNKLPGFLLALYDIEYFGGAHYQNDLSHRTDEEKVKETIVVEDVDEAAAVATALAAEWQHDPYIDIKITDKPLKDKYLVWINNKWVDINERV